MSIEIYTQTKPAHSRRTLLSSLVLIFGTGLLATQMTQARSAGQLGRRVELKAMGCSIKPLRGATLGKAVTLPPWKVQMFHDLVSPWMPADFAVWRASLGERGASDRLAAEIFEELFRDAVTGGGRPSGVRSRQVLVGPYSAVEVWNEESGIIVRVGEVPGKGYIALSMISGKPLKDWRTAFDRSCRSLEVTP